MGLEEGRGGVRDVRLEWSGFGEEVWLEGAFQGGLERQSGRGVVRVRPPRQEPRGLPGRQKGLGWTGVEIFYHQKRGRPTHREP